MLRIVKNVDRFITKKKDSQCLTYDDNDDDDRLGCELSKQADPLNE